MRKGLLLILPLIILGIIYCNFNFKEYQPIHMKYPIDRKTSDFDIDEIWPIGSSLDENIHFTAMWVWDENKNEGEIAVFGIRNVHFKKVDGKLLRTR